MRENHGDTHTRLYSIWKSMKYRCSCANWKPYQWYGAKGITVCDEWNNSYEAFKRWSMSNGYDEKLELDRIDVTGNYTPDNCRWITHHEQTLNRRDTIYCLFDGKKMSLHDFCKEFQISRNTATGWRTNKILDEKLSDRIGTKVVVIGGKKND